MKDENCLFCKIIEGSVPSTKVYENDKVYAFDDINPFMPVHTLIVPKNHYDNIGDSLSDEDMAALFQAVGQVAEIKGIKSSGYRIIVNTGDDALQSVHHVHVHVLGGERMNDGNPSK